MSAVEVRFIFPNHDGVNVFMSTTTSAKGSQLKEHLMNNWPDGMANVLMYDYNSTTSYVMP